MPGAIVIASRTTATVTPRWPLLLLFLNSRSRSQKKITGVTIRTCSRLDTMPPSTGVASGFITSAPALVLHIIGRSEATTVETVITFGRNLSNAPSVTASINDEHQHNRHDDEQATPGTLLVLVLAAPLEVVTGGQLRLPRDCILCFVNKAANIAPTHVQQHRAAQQSILAGNHCRALYFTNVGQLRQRNRHAIWGGNRNSGQA